MAGQIDPIRVPVDVNNQTASGLAGASAEVRAALDRIDAMSATASIKGDDEPLKRAIKEGEAILKSFGAQKAEAKLSADKSAFDNKVAQTEADIKRLQAEDIRIKIKVDKDTQSIRNAASVAKMREEYNKLADEQLRAEKATSRFGKVSEQAGLKAEATASRMRVLEHEITRQGGRWQDITKDIEKNGSTLTRWARTIGKARVSVGPFSGTLRTMGIAVSALGPVIFGVLGTLGSLVGVIGTSLAGALATGGAAFAGFGLAAAGSFMALKPVVHQIGLATKASTAYNDAVLKYGKNSKQAADKQAQLNSILKGVSPATRSAIKDFGSLKTEFAKRTGSVRGNAFDTFAQGIRTAKALMPTFASETSKTFGIAAHGAQSFLKSLRSPEAKQGLADIMGNFRKALPALQSGFGNLAASFGRIFQSGSKQLPSLFSGFDAWTAKIQAAVGSGASLDAAIGRLTAHMQSFGHFTQATGALLTTFFNGGANSGKSLLDTLTKTENRWNSFLQTGKGQNSMAKFFDQSNQTTSQFAQALVHVGRLLFGLSNVARPFTDFLLTLVNVAGSAVNALMAFGPTAAVLKTVGAAMATLFVAGRVGNFAKSLRGSWIGLKLLGPVTDAATGATLANTAALEANTIAMAENVAATEAKVAATDSMIGSQAVLDAELLGGGRTFNRTTGAVTTATVAVEDFAAAGAGAGAATAATTLEVSGLTASTYSATGVLLGLGAAAVVAAAPVLAIGAGVTALAVGLQLIGQNDTSTNTMRDYQAYLKAQDALRTYNQQVTHAAEQGRKWGNNLLLTDRQVQILAGDVQKYKRHLADLASRSGPLGKAIVQQAKLGNIKFPDALSQIQQLNSFMDGFAKSVDNAGGSLDNMIPKLKQLNAGDPATKAFFDQLGHAGVPQLPKPVPSPFSKNLLPATLPAPKIAPIKAPKLPLLSNPKAIKLTAKDETGGKVTGVNRKIASLRDRIVHIRAQDGVSGHVAAIRGRIASLRDRIVHLKATDASSGKIAAVRAKIAGLRDKLIQVKESGSAASRSRVAALQAQIQALQNKTVTVTTNYVTHGTKPGHYQGGPAVPGYAMGIDQQQRAADRADQRATRDSSRGARVNRPTFLTGEEGTSHPEFVIATNPAYRDSNENYLSQAAAQFGYVLVPAFKGGGATKKAKKALKGAPADSALSGWQHQFELAQKDQQFWADEYDLDRRSYDSHLGSGGTQGGFDLPSLLSDLGVTGDGQTETGGGEIGAYRRMLGLLPHLQDATHIPEFNVPSKAKGKNKKQAEATLKRVQNHNTAVDDFKSAIGDMDTRTLDHLITGLKLDAMEISQANAANTILGSSNSNLARYDQFKQFASNIGTPGAGLTAGGTPAGSPALSGPTAGGQTPGTVPFGSAGNPGGVLNPTNRESVAGGGDNHFYLTQTYASTPEDPHTWTRSVLYEMQAATA